VNLPSHSISDLLNWTGGRVANSADLKRPLSDIRVTGVSGLKGSTSEQICFFFSPAYKAEIPFVKAGVLVTGEAFVEPLKLSGLPLWKETLILACQDPYLAMALVSEKFAAYQSTISHVPGEGSGKTATIESSAQVHPSAVLGRDVVVGANCVIRENVVIGDRTVLYPGCFLGPEAKLGQDCVLFPNVVIYEWSELGNRVRIHANSVIGADGFGYAPRTENGQITKQVKIYHLGKVLISDDVEIGALTSVDRGTLNDTRIAAGVKIDNNVQVGHNVSIGEGSIICAGVGLAGSARIGKYVYLAGLAGVSNGILVDDYSKIGPGCLVPTDIPPNKEMLGFPPREANDFFRAHVLMSRLLKEHKRSRGKKSQKREPEGGPEGAKNV
jgi:UDP-3-O-[3-hydroxymyristoyl] glucosamine N-acyltransferase